MTKRALYERTGVTEYWIVDPEREIMTVLHLRDGRYGVAAELGAATGDLLTTALLPGFSLSLAELLP